MPAEASSWTASYSLGDRVAEEDERRLRVIDILKGFCATGVCRVCDPPFVVLLLCLSRVPRSRRRDVSRLVASRTVTHGHKGELWLFQGTNVPHVEESHADQSTRQNFGADRHLAPKKLAPRRRRATAHQWPTTIFEYWHRLQDRSNLSIGEHRLRPLASRYPTSISLRLRVDVEVALCARSLASRYPNSSSLFA
jgi:hypothetical protein